MKATWRTKKTTAVRAKAKRHAVVTKKKKERPAVESIPGTEFLSEKQRKHVKIHTKSARINVSGKRKRKVIKRLRHQKTAELEAEPQTDDVDMVQESSSGKQKRKKKSKGQGMDVD
ncbi:uncharacterized protein [Magallana gigas]|uniref:Uncharacterized protein n=1 Tax=Magallana gigas TaxID=29159 RepID=A0A8W8LMG4_MAGGI|nr:uncharacterized protein LOC105330027 [Crassostrea gigas]|eukprot:XP_011429875.1 PREDICTED: uncharacterized protein LOC105330027 [Crassostrea gigas]